MAQLPRREEERRLAALGIRQQAAELAAERPRVPDENNGDEVNYNQTDAATGDPPYIGNYSKGLRHDSLGDPDPVSYGSLLRALQSRDPQDFEQILLGTIDPGARRMKLTNPQGGLAFDLEGPDAQEPTVPPAPRFDSEVEAHEQGELYWMAVARDVAFVDYASDPLIAQAVSSLNSEFPWFGGTVPVTAQNVFRGIYPGEQVGPYVSQFLWKGNSDPRKMPGGGRNSTDGYVAYGSQVIDQRQQTVLGFPDVGAAADYLTDFAWWLRAQNGEDFRGMDQFDFTTRRFIRNLRDGANYVHFDLVINAWYNAAWILSSEPTGNQLAPAPGAVPMRDREFPKDAGNPYEMPPPESPTEAGFVTFGDPHLIEVLTEVIGLAGRAVWWQKWGVHRRLRPEEFGGRIDNWLNGRRDYPIHPSIKDSLLTGGLSPYFGSPGDRYPSYLLPQAFPRRSAHAPGVRGGARHHLRRLRHHPQGVLRRGQAHREPGDRLGGRAVAAALHRPGRGPDDGGRRDQQAGRQRRPLFPNAAGVHWRSDYTQSLLLGETVAIGLLQELSITFNEDEAFFELTRFDGTTVRIRDGFVDAVPASAGSQPWARSGRAGAPRRFANPQPKRDPMQATIRQVLIREAEGIQEAETLVLGTGDARALDRGRAAGAARHRRGRSRPPALRRRRHAGDPGRADPLRRSSARARRVQRERHHPPGHRPGGYGVRLPQDHGALHTHAGAVFNLTGSGTTVEALEVKRGPGDHVSGSVAVAAASVSDIRLRGLRILLLERGVSLAQASRVAVSELKVLSVGVGVSLAGPGTRVVLASVDVDGAQGSGVDVATSLYCASFTGATRP